MTVFDEIKNLEREGKKIRSKSMYNDDFFGQLNEILEKLEELISKKITPYYEVEYTSYSNNSAKLKINDKKKSIFVLIHCKFIYKKNDIKFWYINPEIILNKKGQKTITYKIWKVKIDEHNIILKKIVQKIIEVIEEF